jgi:hypothetical protein
MLEKLTNEYSISIKGGILENEDSKTIKMEVDLNGDMLYIKVGIIQAMKADETISKLIIDAADYFRENGENFEYNKK